VGRKWNWRFGRLREGELLMKPPDSATLLVRKPFRRKA
jgi:hypothetical protein